MLNIKLIHCLAEEIESGYMLIVVTAGLSFYSDGRHYGAFYANDYILHAVSCKQISGEIGDEL